MVFLVGKMRFREIPSIADVRFTSTKFNRTTIFFPSRLFTQCYTGWMNKRWAHMCWDFVSVVFVIFFCSVQFRKWCQSFGLNTHQGKSDRFNDSWWWIGTSASRPQPYVKYLILEFSYIWYLVCLKWWDLFVQIFFFFLFILANKYEQNSLRQQTIEYIYFNFKIQ